MHEERKDHSRARPARRAFLTKMGCAALASAVLSPAAIAASGRAGPGLKQLGFHHLHTGEDLNAAYWRDGDYDASALGAIDRVLRDFRTGEVHPIEPGLLDFLHRVQRELGVHAPYHVIGGYRSPATNSMLRSRSNGVARRSLHMDGRAIDVRIPGVNTATLREAAADLRLGGVGYYRGSDFVHLDTGRVRVW